MRLRPCHDPSLSELVHTVYEKCGGQYGFYSSHASNHFAIATIVSVFIKEKVQRIWIYALFIWAAVVSYSRIYLGVHYPGDVVTGAIAGTVIAYTGYRFLIFLKPGLHQ